MILLHAVARHTSTSEVYGGISEDQRPGPFRRFRATGFPGWYWRGLRIVSTCPVPKLVSCCWPGVSCSLGCSAVLADQAAEDLPAFDPGRDIDVSARRPRQLLPQALTRTMPVVMTGELGQDLAEVPFAEDQHVIEALAPQCSHEPCGCRILCHLTHATWAYSWIRPPSRSRRRTRTFAPSTGGSSRPAGGLWWSVRCGRWTL